MFNSSYRVTPEDVEKFRLEEFTGLSETRSILFLHTTIDAKTRPIRIEYKILVLYVLHKRSSRIQDVVRLISVSIVGANSWILYLLRQLRKMQDRPRLFEGAIFALILFGLMHAGKTTSKTTATTAYPPSLVHQPIRGVIISTCAQRYIACKGGRCGYNEA